MIEGDSEYEPRGVGVFVSELRCSRANDDVFGKRKLCDFYL